MGLDITFCRKATFLRPQKDDDEADYDGGEYTVWVNDAFEAQADGLATGVYAVEDADRFRAGSYGGYNQWRAWLAREIGGYDAADAFAGLCEGKPFVEMVNFSDCEGLIGPITAAKLAKDFADNTEKGLAEGNWFSDQYRKWQAAFEAAAQGGLVSFH